MNNTLPQKVKTWIELGKKALKEDDHDKALNYFNKALENYPLIGEVWLNKGRAYNGLKMYHDAIKSFDKAIELDPKNYKAWVGKGYALCMLKKYEEAIKCYDKVIELDPENNTAKKNRISAINRLNQLGFYNQKNHPDR